MRTPAARTLLAILGAALSAAVLLLGAGRPATAQGNPPPVANVGTFEATPLPHGGWLVLDTRTGAMEHWQPRQRGYEVHEAGVGRPHARVRMVYPVN